MAPPLLPFQMSPTQMQQMMLSVMQSWSQSQSDPSWLHVLPKSSSQSSNEVPCPASLGTMSHPYGKPMPALHIPLGSDSNMISYAAAKSPHFPKLPAPLPPPPKAHAALPLPLLDADPIEPPHAVALVADVGAEDVVLACVDPAAELEAKMLEAHTSRVKVAAVKAAAAKAEKAASKAIGVLKKPGASPPAKAKAGVLKRPAGGVLTKAEIDAHMEKVHVELGNVDFKISRGAFTSRAFDTAKRLMFKIVDYEEAKKYARIHYERASKMYDDNGLTAPIKPKK